MSSPYPTAEELTAKLLAAGLSAEAAAGAVATGEKFTGQLAAAAGDVEAAKKALQEMNAATDAYIKTQSEADQAAYAKFVEATKAKIAALKAAAGH